MCGNCKGTGYVGGVRCDICNEEPCIHTAKVPVVVDPVYGTEYAYKQDGVCPFCGGTVVVEDGWLICVTPGSCVYSEEIE